MNNNISYIQDTKESIAESSFHVDEEVTYEGTINNNYFNILMVDDCPINLRLMNLILKPLNYNLVKAESGEEALIKISHQDFSLILLDINLPGINGYETARRIKAAKGSEHIPIIFITAHNQDHDQMIEGYSSGAVDYIFKPLSHELLKLKVNAVMKLKNASNFEIEENEKPLLYNGEIVNFLECITDAFLSIDQNWRFTYLNHSAEKQFGKSRYELNGKLLKEECSFLTSEVFDQFEKAMDKQEPVIFEYNVPNTPIWWEVRVYPPQTGLAIYLNDISMRKQLELDLRLTNEQFYKVFQLSPNPIAIRSVYDMSFKEINNSWLQNLGYTFEELNLLKDEIVFTSDTIAIPTHKKEYIMRDQKVHYQTKTGEIKNGLLSTEFIEYKGEPCILYVITDLTEWEQFENELKRLDRLNLVGEMAAGLGHEIRNPMQTVRGFIQLLSGNKEFEEHNQYFSLMISELDRVNDIISEYLNLAKTKRISVEKQDLNDIILTLYPLLQSEANLSGKHIDLQLGEIDDLLLDQKELRQLLLNMVRNGLEASPNNGVLTIKTHKENNQIVLAIKDQGSGISKEVLKNIGTPFFTTKDNGTGLGLAICYSIAQRHNARIDVESGASGTTFLVRFIK